MDFLKNLDQDLRESLPVQLRNLWSHASTAIEGNTLTLGETVFVLQEGLTISGKPLKKDHEEMVGHARQIVFEYAPPPDDVPELMEKWFELNDSLLGSVASGGSAKALDAYVDLHVSFVRIHPFFDGNGRLARLLANIPVLKAGLPPIVIPKTQRKTYIDALSAYHMAAGWALKEKELLPCPDALGPFVSFCGQAWGESLSLVEEVRKIQERRDRILAE